MITLKAIKDKAVLKIVKVKAKHYTKRAEAIKQLNCCHSVEVYKNNVYLKTLR